MAPVVVTTKEELKSAKDLGVSEIIVRGELADQLRKTHRIATLGKPAIATIAGLAAAGPLTGGISTAVGLAGAAAFTGIEVAIIIVAISLGVGFLIALFKDYEADFSIPGVADVSLRKRD